MADPIEATTPSAFIAAKLRPWWFPLWFAGIYGLMHHAYFQIPDDLLRDTLYHWGLVRPDVAVIDLLAPGEQVVAVGNHLVSARANLEIVRGCDGSGAMFLVVSAMLAYPASLGRKLAGVLAAAGFMYLLNLLRIAAIYFVVAYYPTWFLPAHTYFAPTLIVVLGCLFFAWWVAWARSDADGQRRVS